MDLMITGTYWTFFKSLVDFLGMGFNSAGVKGISLSGSCSHSSDMESEVPQLDTTVVSLSKISNCYSIWVQDVDTYVYVMHFCALDYAKSEFYTEFFNKRGHTILWNIRKLDYVETRLWRNRINCRQSYTSDELIGKLHWHLCMQHSSMWKCYEVGFKQQQCETINFCQSHLFL